MTCSICLQTTEVELTGLLFVTADRFPPWQIGTTVAVFQTFGIVEFLIVMSSNSANYGIMASLSSVRISPRTPSGHTILFLPIAASRFLNILMSTVKGSPK